MGMFDEVIFTRPMPDGYTAEASFQTKDMQCELATYRVFDDGRMLKMTNGWTEDAPLDPPVDTDFHGWLNFYDLDKDGGWHEYNAKFTDGRLVEIVPANVK